MINQLQGIWIICSVVLQIHVMLLDAWKKHTWYIINLDNLSKVEFEECVSTADVNFE